MKKHTILYSFFFLVALLGCNSKITEQKIITRNLSTDFESLLPIGSHRVDIMDGETSSPRRKYLDEKFERAWDKNPDFFLANFMEKGMTNSSMNYDSRLGLTKDEWLEHIEFKKNRSDQKAISTGQETVIISKEKNYLYFSSNGKLSNLSNLKIDTKRKIAFYKNHIINKIDTINVSDTNNVYKTKWKGYSFNYTNKSFETLPRTLKALKQNTIIEYRVVIGLLENSQKTYLNLYAYERSSEKTKDSINYSVFF